MASDEQLDKLEKRYTTKKEAARRQIKYLVRVPVPFLPTTTSRLWIT
jgi:hypothetical protein